MNLITHEKTILTNTLTNDWLLRSNKKGDLLVFVSDRTDLRNVALEEKYSNIFTMEPNGDFQLPLTNFEAKSGGPCFSNDGNYLYFDSNKDGSYGIYRYSFTSKKIVGILHEPGSDNVAPIVAPDDSSIVFFSNRDGNFELYRLWVSSNKLERLTTNPAEDLNPAFSPDGTKIVFFSNRSGNYDIYLLDLTQPASTVTMNDLIETLSNLVKTM
jgi:Tol biopolymer transport system component